MTFNIYTDAILSALEFNRKQNEAIARKQEILDGIFESRNLAPKNILFIGFNPAILSCQVQDISVTEISETARSFLTTKGIKFTYVDRKDLVDHYKGFDVVIAMDEYFTFVDGDQPQQDLISEICKTSRNLVITTLRDYRNQDYKDREFSIPIMIRDGSNTKIFIESHNWSLTDRNSWQTRLYEIDESSKEMVPYGEFSRRTMFFKQLAKFSIDAGASDFLVHKNLMYKSLIKRNYEHVISIQLDKNGYR
jgi:hypothetical protein